MVLCLFILVTILDTSLPQLETFAGAVLVSKCVLIVSLGISKPTLMFLQYGGSFSLLGSLLPDPLLSLKDGRLLLLGLLGLPCSESNLRKGASLVTYGGENGTTGISKTLHS